MSKKHIDSLGNRIKDKYEDITRHYLPGRSYYIIRLDGKSFHTYTKALAKPFCADLTDDLRDATIKLCPHIDGFCFAYIQSDEISILFSDVTDPRQDLWFGGNIQKISSVTASILTAEFNKLRPQRGFDDKMAYFDSRVFSIPDRVEVANYFVWRQKDCIRNAINTIAQSIFSHTELQNRKISDVLGMIKGKNIDIITKYEPANRLGSIINKDLSIDYFDFTKKPTFDKLLKMVPERTYPEKETEK